MATFEGGLKRPWAEVIDAQSALLTTAVLFAGVMVYGYAIVDEILVLGFAAMLLLARRQEIAWGQCLRLESLHWAIFFIFIIYLEVESLRGFFFLDDWRMVRFVGMFLGLGLIAIIFRSENRKPDGRDRLVWYLAWAGSAYFALYLLAGIVSENFFATHRFSLQGFVWSGTSTAVFPAFVTFAAMMAVAGLGAKGRQTFWIGYILVCTAGFYYQSRSIWLLVAGSLVVGFHIIGLRRAILAAVIFVAYIFVFPWDWIVPLNGDTLFDESRYTDNRMSLVCRKLGRFADSMVGGMIRDVDKRVFGCPDGEYRVLEGNWVYVPKDPESGYRHETLPTVSIAKEVKTDSAKASAADAEPVADVDRKIAVSAAWRYVRQSPWETFLFGKGYYTHRYELVPVIQAVAAEHSYHFPDGYRQIVRTATFPGMLVDIGMVGLSLLFGLIALTGWGLWRTGGTRSFPALIGLGMVVISLFVSLNYDVILLYLALMPGGAFLGASGPGPTGNNELS